MGMAPPRDNHPIHPIHPATYRFECSKAFYREVWHQLVISSSSARHQLVISSSSARHQLAISSSSAHHLLFISSPSARHQKDCDLLRPDQDQKNKKRRIR